jgi:hypothetical protein
VNAEEKLQQALAKDAADRAAAAKQEQEAKEAAANLQSARRLAQMGFEELKPRIRAAVERLRPVVRSNDITITESTTSVRPPYLGVISFSVNRDGRIPGSLRVILKPDQTIEISNSDQTSVHWQDQALTEDYFYKAFSEVIARMLTRRT